MRLTWQRRIAWDLVAGLPRAGACAGCLGVAYAESVHCDLSLEGGVRWQRDTESCLGCLRYAAGREQAFDSRQL